ncbi:hypothetical protein K438DRAFT_1796477 [Mycena galopus ATCC 62051]|nr:hypothetical protein K438DRAFT_1796477 [Mycena galopus ATCC 62051]
MHRTLRIPELLDLIFAELQTFCSSDEDYVPRESRREILGVGRRDFAALARTCKSFREPALDFLWHEQDTVVNVLKCLPSHLWEEETVITSQSETKRLLRITGLIGPTDWDVPLAYAFRVQKLQLFWWFRDEFPPDLDVLAILRSQLPCDHLFPNLKKLVFRLRRDTSYIDLFLGPKIIDADITLPWNSPISSLRGLPLRYPELQRLHLASVLDGPSMHDVLTKIVLSLNRIQDLRLLKLDRVALEHLSRHCSLRSLRLDLPALLDLELSTPFYSMMDSPTPSFSALRHLHLDDTTIEFVLEFLQFLSNCCLVDFYVGTVEPVIKSTTRRLYAALASRLSHPRLQTLQVSFPEEETEMRNPLGDTPANYAIDGSILAALFCFANLTNIELVPPVGFDIDDTVAQDIARAWPRVKFLRLDGGTDLRHPSYPRMTLLGLKAFAKHCRALVSLFIAFDASTVPSFNDSPNTVPQFSLTFLHVDIAPINDPPAVAAFMSSLFPNLMEIGVHNDWIWGDPAYDETDADDEAAAAYTQFTRWKEVKGILRGAQSAAKALGAAAP